MSFVPRRPARKGAILGGAALMLGALGPSAASAQCTDNFSLVGVIGPNVVSGAQLFPLGGGSSIMGTLSGGGKETISVGERCLLGANAGIGISLGDDCVVEAGCYVTAGTKVTVTDMDGKPAVVKAATLSGVDNILFRRNSVSGAIEAVPWKGDGIALNAALHAN